MNGAQLVANATAALQQRMPARVAAAGLPEIEAFWPHGIDPVPAYPAVEVSVPDADITNIDLANREADVVHTLMVACWVQWHEHDELAARAHRYADLALKSLLEPRALMSGIVQRGAIRVRTSVDPEAREVPQLLAGGLVILQVADLEVVE